VLVGIGSVLLCQFAASEGLVFRASKAHLSPRHRVRVTWQRVYGFPAGLMLRLLAKAIWHGV
jgi:hypothetical protein